MHSMTLDEIIHMEELAKADAINARIAACVNACEGVEDPAKLRTSLGEAMQYVRERMPLGVHRDALTAILYRKPTE